MVPDMVSSVLEALRILGMSRWWILYSQAWSRTLALMRFGLALVSNTQITACICEKSNPF